MTADDNLGVMQLPRTQFSVSDERFSETGRSGDLESGVV